MNSSWIDRLRENYEASWKDEEDVDEKRKRRYERRINHQATMILESFLPELFKDLQTKDPCESKLIVRFSSKSLWYTSTKHRKRRAPFEFWAMRRAQEIAEESTEGRLKGWYVPSKNGEPQEIIFQLTLN